MNEANPLASTEAEKIREVNAWLKKEGIDFKYRENHTWGFKTEVGGVTVSNLLLLLEKGLVQISNLRLQNIDCPKSDIIQLLNALNISQPYGNFEYHFESDSIHLKVYFFEPKTEDIARALNQFASTTFFSISRNYSLIRAVAESILPLKEGINQLLSKEGSKNPDPK